MCAVYATQHLSGGHLNPVISIATAASGHMHWLKAALYVLAQVSPRLHSSSFRLALPVSLAVAPGTCVAPLSDGWLLASIAS